MQTTVQETDKHKVKLTVEIPTDRFGKDLDAAYRRVAQQVKVPGFRKGKAPRRVIDAQVGREAVVAEFLEDAVPTYYREAIRENELAPITDPDIALEQVEEESRSSSRRRSRSVRDCSWRSPPTGAFGSSGRRPRLPTARWTSCSTGSGTASPSSIR